MASNTEYNSSLPNDAQRSSAASSAHEQSVSDLITFAVEDSLNTSLDFDESCASASAQMMEGIMSWLSIQSKSRTSVPAQAASVPSSPQLPGSDHRFISKPNPQGGPSTSHYNRKEGFYWENLPTELRQQIFDEVERATPSHPYFKRTKKLPALVVALRGVSNAQAHILEHFHKINNGILHLKCPSALKSMDKVELASIRHLSLEIHLRNRTSVVDGSITRPYESPDEYAKHFLNLPNIRGIKARLSYWDSRETIHCKHFICHFPLWLKAFKNLRWVEVDIPRTCDEDGWTLDHLSSSDLELGLRARIQRWNFRRTESLRCPEIWRWEVEGEDGGMDWSQDIWLRWRKVYPRGSTHPDTLFISLRDCLVM
ncbi:uncharacterized protein LY89DRAFT_779617 [Mollisia scopiformis]|uniref:Uncharacterized protein n=1 Tax=Mollisia scopiformis TaxID=149040 RepID=A0A194XIV8_MOLSC|nr:uncharacterized protein LY89DRAFT_779617 [Mollisia scopiformis]KUJ19702.1 hypothetical protein LY89DRAFT_779617 [Mollisia scopiformis]